VDLLKRQATETWTVATISSTVGVLYYPQGFAFDSAGNLYVTDNGNNVIRKITSSETIIVFAGTVGSAGSVDAAARFREPQESQLILQGIYLSQNMVIL
jgi:DNA-binding beta-propeller fold protein YncE